MNTKWFAVKTLHRWSVNGRASKRAPRAATVDLLEERVVLLRATTARQAIARAERCASEYSNAKAINPYNQEIRGQYLGSCECFRLFDPPGDLTEVFSSTELINKRRTDRQIADARLGRRRRDELGLRRLFADREFMRNKGRSKPHRS